LFAGSTQRIPVHDGSGGGVGMYHQRKHGCSCRVAAGQPVAQVERDAAVRQQQQQQQVQEVQEVQEVQDQEQFLTEEEMAMDLSESQLEFLVRKRKAAMGLGPIMPASSMCSTCDGVGTVECHQCKGSGQNRQGVSEEIFGEQIISQNGVFNARWLFSDQGPCWLCKGMQHIGCPDCSGTGIAGGVDRFTGD